MAWGFVAGQAVNAGDINATAATTGAFAGALTVGNRLIVGTTVWYDGSPQPTCTVTDSKGNTWTKHVSVPFTDGSTTGEFALHSTPITAGGASATLTATSSQTSGSRGVGLSGSEFSNLSTTSGAGALDGSVSATGVSGTASSGTTPATTAANELAVAYFSDDGWSITLTSGSVGSGWTFLNQLSGNGYTNMLLEYRDTGASGSTVTGNLASGQPGGSGVAWGMVTAVFKLAGGGAVLLPRLSLMGVG